MGIISIANDYNQKIVKENYTQASLAKMIGKSRSYITNVLRLLNLPEIAQKAIENEKLSIGHGKIILQYKPKIKIIQTAIDQKLSIRQLITLCEKAQSKNSNQNEDLIWIEQQLTDSLNMKVKIKRIKQQGTLSITFRDGDELNRILEILS